MKIIPTNKTYFRLTIKLLLDTLVFITAFLLSYLLRFPIDDVLQQIKSASLLLLIFVLLQLASFALFKLYSMMWRYSSLQTLKNILMASALSTILIGSFTYFFSITGVSRSILINDWLWVVLLSGGTRMVIR